MGSLTMNPAASDNQMRLVNFSEIASTNFFCLESLHSRQVRQPSPCFPTSKLYFFLWKFSDLDTLFIKVKCPPIFASGAIRKVLRRIFAAHKTFHWEAACNPTSRPLAEFSQVLVPGPRYLFALSPWLLPLDWKAGHNHTEEWSNLYISLEI